MVPIALLVAITGLAVPGRTEQLGSRVIVSTTLNSTLQFFDAQSLEHTQAPLLSRGLGPVRMTLYEDVFYDSPLEGNYLFVANHGVQGSVGVFDLSGEEVTELPLSPFPARPGSVGIAAARVLGKDLNTRGLVVVTNTWQALGGCGQPAGSITAFSADLLAEQGIIYETATIDTAGPVPYGVALDAQNGNIYASSNCSDTLDTATVQSSGCLPPFGCTHANIEHAATRSTGAGPDAVLFDVERSLVYVTNIDGDSLSVFDPASPGALTTVPLPGAGPIDAALASSPGGRDWVITSNGQDDTVSLIDRDLIAGCIVASAPSCPQAEVLRIPTGVPGGAPEGVAYDPVSNRIFVVNKAIMGPSLTVLQLDESGGGLSASKVADIPLQALGAGTALPAVIAFDVIVQPR